MTKVIEKEAKETHKKSLPEAPKHVTDEIFVNNWKIRLNDFVLNDKRKKIKRIGEKKYKKNFWREIT